MRLFVFTACLLFTTLAGSAYSSSGSTREGFVICETKEKLNEAYSLLLKATPKGFEKVARYIELGICARLEDGLKAKFTGTTGKPEKWGMPAEVSIGGGKFWVLKQSIDMNSGKVYLDGNAPKPSIPSIWPVNGWVTSGFGFRVSPFSGRREMHRAVDIAASLGSDIIATADGTVLKSGVNGGYGKEVVIDHGNGITTRYAHNASNLVQKGERVRFGQIIAKVGNSGKSTGPHLHYELLVNGEKQDPHRYFRLDVKPPRRVAALKNKKQKDKKLSKGRYEKAVELHEAGEDDEAFKLFIKSAKREGDRRSQYMLGLAYSLGNGTKRNSRAAAYWFKKSSMQGYADAQYYLGRAYSFGDGLPKDRGEALKWLKLSAEQGSFAGMELYGRELYLAKRYEDAVFWSAKVAGRSALAKRHLAIAQLAAGNEREAHILYNSLARSYREDKRLLRGVVDDLRRYRKGKGRYLETAKKMLWKYFNVRE